MKGMSESCWGALRVLNGSQGAFVPSPAPRVVGARRSRPSIAFFTLVKRGYAERRDVLKDGGGQRAHFKITQAGVEALLEHERQETS
jgi:hypothetical protein